MDGEEWRFPLRGRWFRNLVAICLSIRRHRRYYKLVYSGIYDAIFLLLIYF